MDGFHIADALLAADGRRERKGAPDTFDVDGYLALLRRLKEPDRIVYAPRFDRAIEDSIAAAIAVPAGVPLVVTEGNYLLHWPEVRAALDEVWYLDPPPDLRRERLIARHRAFGRDEAQAQAFALGSDERNAELIAAGRARADLVIAVEVPGLGGDD